MAKSEKNFNTKLYAVIVFFLVAGILASVTVITYKSKYNGFYPEKVATAYVDSIVARSDGYNAYKNTLVSKNFKYGDYIRRYYMYPLIYSECGYTAGAETDSLKGFNDESFMGEKTKNDNGTLTGQVIDEMFVYYGELMTELGGWDNYDAFFTKYFNKLVEVREKVFGDRYMTDEIMFTSLEANVSSYGDLIAGADEVIDENTNLVTEEKVIGKYEELYGEDYEITYNIGKTEEINLAEYKKSCNKDTFDTYTLSTDDISQVKEISVEVLFNGKTEKTVTVTTVKINSTWYVDNTITRTSVLYP